MTAIVSDFDGLFEMDLGLRGGRVLIDGRKPALPSPITDTSSTTK
jgi:hypothetical protein